MQPLQMPRVRAQPLLSVTTGVTPLFWDKSRKYGVFEYFLNTCLYTEQVAPGVSQPRMLVQAAPMMVGWGVV